MTYENNKDTETRSPISAFAVGCLHSMIPIVALSEMVRLLLASGQFAFYLSLDTVHHDGRFGYDT